MTDLDILQEKPEHIGTLYIWAEDGTYSHSEEVDLRGPLPRRSTFTAPPEAQGDLVPQWLGRWVLGERPAPYEPAVPASEVDAERDLRIDAGFDFEGVRYQSRPGDRENIAGAVLIAIADPAYTTGWIAADNSVVQMDAPTLLRFGRTAADHKQALIFAARQLKDMQPIPQDYTDDKWWP